MVRVLAAALSLLALSAATAEDKPSRYSFVAGMDISLVNVSGHPSWINGSAGKLRFDDDGLSVSRTFADYKLRLADTVNLKIAGEYYHDDIGGDADFTQAYLEWRPLTLSRNRYRFKLGGFYPRLSLENTGPSWSTPYTITSSAINTWIAEEMRILGIEFGVTRRLESFGGDHEVSLYAAGFQHNDPLGGMIAWKGWSIHDRQSRFGDELPLPPLPQIQPDGFFWRQDPYFIPFQENDSDIGWYVSGDWKYRNRFLLRATHYDNRADPTNVRNGQYGWYTEFDALGLQLSLPANIGLIAQWLDGSTVMGPIINGAYVVDTEFNSNFVLLTTAIERHRLSARYDHFEVSENDQVPLDENREQGYAWTLSYQFEATRNIGLAAEWLEIHTNRPAWAYNGLDVSKTETLFILSLRLRFGDI